MLSQHAAYNKLSRSVGGHVGAPSRGSVASDSCLSKSFPTGRHSEVVSNSGRVFGWELREVPRTWGCRAPPSRKFVRSCGYETGVRAGTRLGCGKGPSDRCVNPPTLQLRWPLALAQVQPVRWRGQRRPPELERAQRLRSVTRRELEQQLASSPKPWLSVPPAASWRVPWPESFLRRLASAGADPSAAGLCDRHHTRAGPCPNIVASNPWVALPSGWAVWRIAFIACPFSAVPHVCRLTLSLQGGWIDGSETPLGLIRLVGAGPRVESTLG